jgi:hypothetical protein
VVFGKGETMITLREEPSTDIHRVKAIKEEPARLQPSAHGGDA